MARSIIALSVAIAVSIVTSGCAYLINHWPHELNFATAPRQHRPHRMVTHESSGANGEMAPESEASPSPSTGQGSPAGPGEAKPTVTIAGHENATTRAETLPKAPDPRLARAYRPRLKRQAQPTYRH